ncbi:hypothetical protein GCM10011309_01020 [Litorimonas cladophorae]|uniref:Uncharacterized protein n=1 Tax=Litorimonas cladophorae TaxID=1220491 RepID=A0A918K9M4_9PROT|nr:hypothetical protein [Litorimonas cladophorae]GGX56093.1 hypothetical protein GCM10011309_01020 [Litorimonas cladophorae]
MKWFLIIAFCFLSYPVTADACDFPPPDIKTSEFVSDKTVFWGRATAKKWDPDAVTSIENNFPTSTYLEVEVIRQLKGDVRKNTKVWLSETSCGIDVTLGNITLFVVKPIGGSDFYADMMVSSLASDRAIISLFKLDLDVQIGGHAYPPDPNWLEAPHWKKWLMTCQSDETNGRPQDCLSLDELEEITDAYETEYESVKNITWQKTKPWWKKFTK